MRELIEKECEICGGHISTYYKQQKYCEACKKNSDRKKKYAEKNSIMLQRKFDSIPMKKQCKYCGRDMVAEASIKYCSKQCKDAATAPKYVKCKMCENNLLEVGEIGHYGVCSDRCLEALHKYREAEKLRIAKEDGAYIPCKVCKTMFISKKFAECCSTACNKKLRDYRSKKKHELKQQEALKNKAMREEIIEKQCKICNSKYKEARGTVSNYCSAECKKEWQRVKKLSPLDIKMEALEKENKLHLCTSCRTSQIDCERFTSNFSYSPKGAKWRKVDNKMIIVECPKYKK